MYIDDKKKTFIISIHFNSNKLVTTLFITEEKEFDFHPHYNHIKAVILLETTKGYTNGHQEIIRQKKKERIIYMRSPPQG